MEGEKKDSCFHQAPEKYTTTLEEICVRHVDTQRTALRAASGVYRVH